MAQIVDLEASRELQLLRGRRAPDSHWRSREYVATVAMEINGYARPKDPVGALAWLQRRDGLKALLYRLEMGRDLETGVVYSLGFANRPGLYGIVAGYLYVARERIEDGVALDVGLALHIAVRVVDGSSRGWRQIGRLPLIEASEPHILSALAEHFIAVDRALKRDQPARVHASRA